MKFKRRFKKYFNRSMPLFCAQYWYQGERYGLPQITDKSVYYNPLFIYQKDKATDVYYDIDQEDRLIDYFKKHPEKFKNIANQYRKESRELSKLSRESGLKFKDISRIFNLHLASWPKLCIMMVLGEKAGFRAAYQLRKEFGEVEYSSGNNLIELVEQSLPDYADFTDFLLFEEIVDKKIPQIKELEKRKQGYIYFEDKLYADSTLEQLEKMAGIKIIRQNLSNDGLLKGRMAMPGKAKGKVKIVLDCQEMSKVKKGDILVAPMTTPDYLMAMRKASAFVTDEGGLTCHAAIVAREIGKPCLIGTKTATRVLKDGDLVEVDAEKGRVKIIKKAN